MSTILLIEDDRDCVRMVTRLLESHAHIVHHAPTGLAGLSIAHRTDPDLILVDIGLPDLDGKVIAMRLRSLFEGSHRPIVAFTAESGARAKRLALGFGCDYFISKPIDTQTFPDDIAQILSR